jgi:hypothetical protein
MVIGAIGLLGDFGVRQLRLRACAWQEGLTVNAT